MRAIQDRSIDLRAGRSLTAGLLFAFMIACAPNSAPVVAQLAPPPAVLPELQRVMVPGLDSLRSTTAMECLAVSGSGHLAFMRRSDGSKTSVAIVDTLGKVVRLAVADSGQQCALSKAQLIFLPSDTDLLLLNLESRRFERFGVDGTHKNTSAVFEMGMPIGVAFDSVDMLIFNDEAMSPLFQSINRVSLKTLEWRTVIDTTDSTFAAFRGPVASNSRGIVLAHGGKYWLQSYSRDGRPMARWGRDLPPRLMTGTEVDAIFGKKGPDGKLLPYAPGVRERYMQQPERHFYNIVFDGAGRLWAVGRDTSATYFADVFADTTFVGRMPLPCQALALQPLFNGQWVAFKCGMAKDAKETEIQLYRVVK